MTGSLLDAARNPTESTEIFSSASRSFGPELVEEWSEGVLSILIEAF